MFAHHATPAPRTPPAATRRPRALAPLLTAAAALLLVAGARAELVGLSHEVVATGLQLDGRELVTLRVHAHFDDEGDVVQALASTVVEYLVEGTPISVLHPLQFSTTDPLGFYQHPLGGNTSAEIDPALFAANPGLAYDSWLTLGAEDQLDNPLMEIGMDWAEFHVDAALDETDGAVFLLAADSVPATGGRVLLAQLTVGVGEFVMGSVNIDGALSPSAGNFFFQAVGRNFVYQACATPADDLSYGTVSSSGFYPKLQACGSLGSGGSATLDLRRAPPHAPALLLASFDAAPFYAKGGFVVPAPPFGLLLARTTDANGELRLTAPGMPDSFEFVVQWLVADALVTGGVTQSNALRLHVGD